MEIGIIGLGKMGLSLANNMSDKGIKVFGYDVNEVNEPNIDLSTTISDLVSKMSKPRIIWLMLPAGKVTNSVLIDLSELLSEGDIVIDGGNSYFIDSIENFKILNAKKIEFLDCGTSGGVVGALEGPCLMIGGDRATYNKVEKIFEIVAENGSFGYTGEIGSGHYAKMVHNGIEYAMMQAIAEGFNLMNRSEYNFDLAEVSKIWKSASIISGYLMDITHDVLIDADNYIDLSQRIDSSGEGKWTVMEGLRLETPLPTISASLNVRYASKESNQISNKLVSAMREKFGGHKTYKEEN